MRNKIIHVTIPSGMDYFEYVNRMDYKYVLPQGKPVIDASGDRHYLMQVVMYTTEDYIYGDGEYEQDCIDREMYG